jgi:ribose transport system substrate-binding protein
MRQQVLVSLFVSTTMLAACGSSSGDNPTPDAGGLPQADAAPVASPFAPAAIEAVITQTVAAIEARGLTSSQKPPIAVLLKELTGFWSPVVIGANRMSTRLVTPSVVEAPLITDPANTTEVQAGALQNQYITSYLTSKVYKGMAYAPHSANADTVAMLNNFIGQCGPVVTIDSDVPDSARSYLIATANYQAGATAGKKLLEVMAPGSTVAVFGTTQAAWVSGIQRSLGAEEALAAGGMVVAARISPVWDAALDKQNLITALSDPTLNITGLVCMYSNSFNCAAAVEALGKKGMVQIVGFDMESATKTYFDQGYFHGIAVQRQYYMGQLGVLGPYAISVLGPAQTAALLQPILVDATFIDTGIDIITTANFAAYMTFLSELGINA